jgi:hypothetical protein
LANSEKAFDRLAAAAIVRVGLGVDRVDEQAAVIKKKQKIYAKPVCLYECTG